jgi:aryl-alcohol dehydrogenase-like predicted oxidoreductase
MNPDDIAIIMEAAARKDMPTRKLGRTGLNIPIVSLGGQGALEEHGSRKNCIEIIHKAYSLGIKYMDTSPVYGPSEDIYGEALKGIRNKIVVASKTDDRTRDGSLKLLEKSLKRLKTDYLDVWQIHHLDNMNDVNAVTKKDGALKAIVEMKEQGVVRHIGFTGHHSPKVLAEMARRHDFDTALCALNPADRHLKPCFIDDFLPIANEKKLGIIGMKVFAQGFIFHPGTSMWKGIMTAWETVFYTLSLPITTIIIGCNTPAQVEENVMMARAFRQLDKDEMVEIEGRTKRYVKRAQFFRDIYGGYKSRDKLGEPYII